MEFAIQACRPYLKCEIKALESVQHRATKVSRELSGLNYESRCANLELTSLEVRRNRGDLIEMYKIANGIDKIDWTAQLSV